MMRSTITLTVLLSACTAQSSLDDWDPASDEPVDQTQQAATVLAAPMPMRSGAWWGDTATPLINQIWGEVTDATPGRNLTAPLTYHWTCTLPVFTGFRQSLTLTLGSISVDSTVVKSFTNPSPGQVLSFTIDPAAYGAGWHEIRIRCKGKETTGTETGQITAITAGFPIQFNGGTSTGENHSGTNYVDTHGWYSRGLNYVYATILNISDLISHPQSGLMRLDLKARTSGDTTLDHFMVKLDGQIATTSDGLPAEFHGTTGTRTVYIDTRLLANGAHKLAMHSHGIEIATSEQPGKQLAAQVEVTIQVNNP